MTVVEIDTPHGPAGACAGRRRGRAALGHGAGGGVTSRDLVAVSGAAVDEGLTVVLVEQPYRVAGRRSPAPAHQLDTAWTAVLDASAAASRTASRSSSADARPARGSPAGRRGRSRRRALRRLAPAAASNLAGAEPAAGARRSARAGVTRATAIRSGCRRVSGRSSPCAATTAHGSISTRSTRRSARLPAVLAG